MDAAALRALRGCFSGVSVKAPSKPDGLFLEGTWRRVCVVVGVSWQDSLAVVVLSSMVVVS